MPGNFMISIYILTLIHSFTFILYMYTIWVSLYIHNISYFTLFVTIVICIDMSFQIIWEHKRGHYKQPEYNNYIKNYTYNDVQFIIIVY